VRLTALAPAKINLCLFLGPVRAEDGRHELVTLFESLSLADELVMTEHDGDRDEVACPGVEGPNLVSAALAGLRDLGWDAPPLRVEIAKRIPVAAGLGGGSADAAAVLRMAVEISPGRPEEISDLAAGLGADVPGQLAPGLALGTGAGEIVEPLAEPLAPHALVLVPGPQGLSTADVYREADRLGLPRLTADLDVRHLQLLAALSRPRARLPAQLLVNDLEPASGSLCPPMVPALQAVREAGADHSLVCGSGPTVAGLFWGTDAADRAALAAGALAARFPAATVAEPVGAEFGLPRLSG
jgi:4-diphosphocytidyl-2-C-methyl-D-erythritol kinase